MTSSTDTPKRDESLAEIGLLLKQAEVAALEWLNCDRYSKRLGPVSELPDCDDTNGRKNIALRMLRAVRGANFSTPPSQGKVEISEDGICWTCKCGWRSTFLDLKCPGCGNGQPAIYAAITQALTESSAQGTDGAERLSEGEK